jgi:hypothetical protein
MKNVTITPDESVVRWARYEAAQRQCFDIEPRLLRQHAGHLPRREELHDRCGLR